jgi:hypothetical protein
MLRRCLEDLGFVAVLVVAVLLIVLMTQGIEPWRD